MEMLGIIAVVVVIGVGLSIFYFWGTRKGKAKLAVKDVEVRTVAEMEKPSARPVPRLRTTVQLKNGPPAKVELVGNEGFKIELENLRRAELIDQSDEMLIAAGQGCISNPTGPSC
jgi:hypothetical protein